MTFKPECSQAFKAHFEGIKNIVRGFEGCLFLELYVDADDENVMITHSYWRDAAALEAYRTSDTFAKIWRETKPLMAGKTFAFSMYKISEA
jgi:quinol monooxygenase YgiN